MFEATNKDDGIQDFGALVESYIADMYYHMDDESAKSFLESDDLKALEEAKVVNKRTLVRLSKQDDYTRRVTLAALQKAKESNSPDWKKLRKAQKMRKEALAAIVKRYGNSVKRDVVKAQRAIQKIDPTHYTRIPGRK